MRVERIVLVDPDVVVPARQRDEPVSQRDETGKPLREAARHGHDREVVARIGPEALLEESERVDDRLDGLLLDAALPVRRHLVEGDGHSDVTRLCRVDVEVTVLEREAESGPLQPPPLPAGTVGAALVDRGPAREQLPAGGPA